MITFEESKLIDVKINNEMNNHTSSHDGRIC